MLQSNAVVSKYKTVAIQFTTGVSAVNPVMVRLIAGGQSQESALSISVIDISEAQLTVKYQMFPPSWSPVRSPYRPGDISKS